MGIHHRDTKAQRGTEKSFSGSGLVRTEDVEDFRSLGLGEEVERKVLWENATRMFPVL